MNLSFHRFVAVLQKELTQMRRDRFTLALMVGMPLVQLFLFGFAINTDPKHLPTALVLGDDSRTGTLAGPAMRATEYFDICSPFASRGRARDGARRRAVRPRAPADFARRVERREHPRSSSRPMPPTPPR